MHSADRQKMRFFEKFCFIRKVSTKSCRMNPVGLSYDQNSRFSQFRNFFENQIYYKGGVFIKQEMVNIFLENLSFKEGSANRNDGMPVLPLNWHIYIVQTKP